MPTIFQSTKFWMTLIVLVLSYILVFVGKLEAKTWFEFATVGLGLFAGANVIEKFAP